MPRLPSRLGERIIAVRRSLKLNVSRPILISMITVLRIYLTVLTSKSEVRAPERVGQPACR